VIDPLISKRQQLMLATQLCRMVLKVCYQYVSSCFISRCTVFITRRVSCTIGATCGATEAPQQHPDSYATLSPPCATCILLRRAGKRVCKSLLHGARRVLLLDHEPQRWRKPWLHDVPSRSRHFLVSILVTLVLTVPCDLSRIKLMWHAGQQRYYRRKRRKRLLNIVWGSHVGDGGQYHLDAAVTQRCEGPDVKGRPYNARYHIDGS
jgi:hypothetical protein